jgi:hypothetical protein
MERLLSGKRATHLEREYKFEKLPSALFVRKGIFVVLAVLYAGGAILSAWNVISHTQASTKAIEGILERYNMKNEGSLAVDRYAKEHPILGMLFSSPVKKEMELPSHNEAAYELSSEVTKLLKTVRTESSVAAWWSWALLSISLAYIVTLIALNRSFTARSVLFGLDTVAVVCFVIGILAPAMVVWTAPSIPMESGDLNFVLQHQVRGIAAIIWELLTKGHWVVGGFLLLFSVVTPMTKALLTYFITWSESKELNEKIGVVLHSIGKWSMADVFVAGILLSLYALKAQEATKSIPCLGLYYFIGYCMFSMTTTELLTHSGLVAGHGKKPRPKLTPRLIGGLIAGAIGFVSLSSLYTYEQYTQNTKKEVIAPASPQSLDNSHLVLPAHK